MARPREDLQTLLESLLGSRNVYFQPPESVRLCYPCIVYERSGMRADPADNVLYRKLKRYTVTYMDADPDAKIWDRLSELAYCSFDRHFTSDGLNHEVFTLYF